MAAIDRRTFLRGIAYAVLGRVLGWEITEIADADAAPEEKHSDSRGCLPMKCDDCAISNMDRLGEYVWVCNDDGTVWVTNWARQIWYRYECYCMPGADATMFIPKDPELP